MVQGIDLTRGVYLLACQYGVLPQSQPARCMTRAEYKAEKAKSANSTPQAEGQPTDPRYKDWIPGTP